MCKKKLYVPTLMKEINLIHRGQLSATFESQWIVFGNAGHNEKKILQRLAGRYGEIKEDGCLIYN